MARQRNGNTFPVFGRTKLDRCINGGDLEVEEQIYSETFSKSFVATRMIGGPYKDANGRYAVLSTAIWNKNDNDKTKTRLLKQFNRRYMSHKENQFPTYQELTDVARENYRLAIEHKDDNLMNERLAALGANSTYTLFGWYPRLETAQRVRELLNDDDDENAEDVIARYERTPVNPDEPATYKDFFLPKPVFDSLMTRDERQNGGVVPQNEENEVPQGNEVNEDDDDSDNNNDQADRIEQQNLFRPVVNEQSTNDKRPNGGSQTLAKKKKTSNSKSSKSSSDASNGGEFDPVPSTSKQQHQPLKPITNNPSNHAVAHSSQLMMNNAKQTQKPNSVNSEQTDYKFRRTMIHFMHIYDLPCEIDSQMWKFILELMNVFTNESAFMPLAHSEHNAVCMVCQCYEPNDKIVSCQRCTASVHSKCYSKMIEDPKQMGKFTCEACQVAPFWEIGCADCQQADGGVYRRHAQGMDIWFHGAYYLLFAELKWRPGSRCCYCKRPSVLSIGGCSEQDPTDSSKRCSGTFHPCCVVKEGNIRKNARNRWEGICDQHQEVSMQLKCERVQKFGVDKRTIRKRLRDQHEAVKQLSFIQLLPHDIFKHLYAVIVIYMRANPEYIFQATFLVNVLKCWIAVMKTVGGGSTDRLGHHQLSSYGRDRMANAIQCQAQQIYMRPRLVYPEGYDAFLDFSRQQMFLDSLLESIEKGVYKFVDYCYHEEGQMDNSIYLPELHDTTDDSSHEDEEEEEKE